MSLIKLHGSAVKRLLARADALELSRDARKRLQWFAYHLHHGCNVSRTCRYFGIARSTFLRWMDRFHPEDPRTLEEHSRRPKRVRMPETDERAILLIKAYREQSPLIGKDVLAALLRTQHGLEISPATVGRVIRRYGFFYADSDAHARKRMEPHCPPPLRDEPGTFTSEVQRTLLPSDFLG